MGLIDLGFFNQEKERKKEEELEALRTQKQNNAQKQKMELSLEKGRKRGEELFQLSPEEKAKNEELLKRYEDYSKGLSAQELQGFRENAAAKAASDYATSARQMKVEAGAQGGRGGALSGQLGQLKQMQAQTGLQNERDIFLQNVGMQRTGLDQYGQAISAIRKEELARAAGIGGMETAYGGLQATNQAQQSALEAALLQAQQQAAAIRQSNSGGTWLCTEAISISGENAKLLRKFKLYALKNFKADTKFYIKHCWELVSRMKKENADWNVNKKFVKEVLSLIKENKLKEAYIQYNNYVTQLINKHWSDCDYDRQLIGVNKHG